MRPLAAVTAVIRVSAARNESDEFTVHSYHFIKKSVHLRAGDGLNIIIQANGPFRLYVVDEENLGYLREGKPFRYLGLPAATRDFARSFKAPSDGKWYVVVLNRTQNDIAGTWAVIPT